MAWALGTAGNCLPTIDLSKTLHKLVTILIMSDFKSSILETGTWRSTRLLTSLLVLFAVGCGTSKPEPDDNDRMTRAILGIVGEFYGAYLNTHKGRPPKDNQDFYRFLESRADELRLYNVENPDQLYDSYRDNRPLVIVSGEVVSADDASGSPYAAFEQQGVDGRIYAVRVRGGIHEMSAEEAAELFVKN